MTTIQDPWVIRKGGAFYRSNRQGYTNHIEAAGLYTKEEAEAEAAHEPHRIDIYPLSQYRAQLEQNIRMAQERLTAINGGTIFFASFQARVLPWLLECFGQKIASDPVERADRFIEEALELVQSNGYDRARAHALVDYVFNRPAGEPDQEAGGVMVTLASYCVVHALDMHVAGERELARILRPEIMEKIRTKQKAKPTGSALPVAV